MYYLFNLKREFTKKAVECLAGKFKEVPIIGYRDPDKVSRVKVRLDERYVPYVRRVEGGETSNQRFNEVGELEWRRTIDGRDYLMGAVFSIPVIVYGQSGDFDTFNVYVDEDRLIKSSKEQKAAALAMKKKPQIDTAVNAGIPTIKKV